MSGKFIVVCAVNISYTSGMMTLKDRLLVVAEAFANARGLSESRVSTMAFGDGKVISRLKRDSDLTTGRYETSMAWFSANWPDGADWPAKVERPKVAA